MPNSALMLAIIAMLGWASVGIFRRFMQPQNALEPYIWFAVINLIITIGIGAFQDFVPFKNLRWNWWGVALGIGWSVGGLSFIMAAGLAPLKIPQIVSITALYAAVAALAIYLIFHDPISPKEWVGIAFACIAAYLLSGK